MTSCDSCADSPIDPLAVFDSIWHCDFEYRQDANGHPVPVCMFAQEQRTDAEIFLWREELLALKEAPFPTGPRNLMVVYSGAAELSCFAVLGLQAPCNVLDVMVEVRTQTNGLTIEGLRSQQHPGLLEALEMYGLPSTVTKVEKDQMRDLILGKDDYSPEEREAIRRYNMSDVQATLALLPALLPSLDIRRALFLGRFVASAITPQQLTGLPIDRRRLNALLVNWEGIRRHFICRDDEFELYDGTSFAEQRLADLIQARGWDDWPRTPTGKYKRDARTMGEQSSRHPELKKTAHMMSSIGELRLNDLAGVVGTDSFARSWLAPFGSRTGRNQPPGATFLPALPAWVRGLLRPPAGWVLVELDWICQEYGLIAGMCGDPGMIADYESGDVYTALGVRLGLLPPNTVTRLQSIDPARTSSWSLSIGLPPWEASVEEPSVHGDGWCTRVHTIARAETIGERTMRTVKRV